MLKRKKIYSYLVASAIMMNSLAPVAIQAIEKDTMSTFDQKVIQELSDSKEVVLAVIGGGFDTSHPDLKDYIYTNDNEIPGNGIDDDGNGYIDDVNGWDFSDNNNVVSHDKVRESSNTAITASIIKSIEDIKSELGEDISVKLLPVRFIGSRNPNQDLINSIKYAESMGANLAYCLFTNSIYSKAVYETMLESKMLFVTPAGEGRSDIDGVDKMYPASYLAPNILSVTSVDTNNNISNFANYGKLNVDIAALGEDKVLPRVAKEEKTAAIYRETESYKTLFHGFGYEQIAKEDRAGLMKKSLDKLGINTNSKVLVVDDYSNYEDVGSVYEEALNSLNINYDKKKVEEDLSPTVLKNYDLVMWVGGYGLGNLPADIIQNNLISYLKNGGNLYIMGEEIGTHGYDTDLFREYMDIKFVGEDFDRINVGVVGGDKFKFDEEERLRQKIDCIGSLTGKSTPFLVYPKESEAEAFTKFSSTAVSATEVTATAATLIAKGVNGFDNVKRIILDNAKTVDNLGIVCSTSGVLDTKKAIENIGKIDNNQIPGELLDGNSVEKEIGIDGDNIDIYRVLLNKDDTVMAMTGDTSWPSTAMDTDIYIYGPKATKLDDEVEIVAKSNQSGTSSEYISEYKVQETGYHYIVVKNEGQEGKYGLRVYTNNKQNSRIQVDDNSGEIEYAGKWNTINSWDHSNATLHQLNSEGKATFKFTGNKFEIYGTKDKNQGKMGIAIDGVPVREVSLYSDEKENRALLYEKELGYGDHTVEIFWTGVNDPNGKTEATSINIDHIVYDNTVTEITKPKLYAPRNDIYIEQILLGIEHRYNPNIKEYKIYRSEDAGQNYKQITTVRAWPTEILAYVDSFKDTNVEKKEYFYKVVAIDNNDVASEPSIVKATPKTANSKYYIENDSGHMEFVGKWNTVKAINGGSEGNTTSVSTTVGSKVRIPLTGEAMDIFLDTGDYSDSATVGVSLVSQNQGVEISTDENFRNGASNYRISITPAINDGPIVNGYVELTNKGGTFGVDKVQILDIDNGIAPKYPTGLNGTVTQEGIKVEWKDNSETDVKGYDVYRSDRSGLGYKKINETLVSGTSFVDKTTETGKTYYYHIRAIDYANNQSHASEEIKIEAIEVTNPDNTEKFNVLAGSNKFETATLISKQGFKDTAENVVLVSPTDPADSLMATPFATAKNAPILLSNTRSLPTETINELTRLKTKNVYIIGEESAINKNVVNELKSMGITTTRIAGKTKYETSLEVAKYIDEVKDVESVYLVAGSGEKDAFSIASKTGSNMTPVILVNRDKLDTSAYDWMKKEKLNDAYIVGNEDRLSSSTLQKINDITTKDISGNRISGSDAQSINASVIEKLYTNSELESIFVTQSDVLDDSLAVGPLAAKYNAPIVMGTNDLNVAQEKVIQGKQTKSVYQIGQGIKDVVINKIKALIK